MATWDDYAIDVGARRLTGPDGDIHVEPQVFDVLALLVAERDRVVPKAEILERVWGDQFVSESALTTRIKQARRSLGDDGRTQRYIRNVHGRGYQFVGSVADDGQTGTDPAPTPGPVDDAGPGSTTTQPGRPVELARDIAVDDDFPFVGRAGELERADAALARSRDGASGVIVIGGSPGAGKSRLAIEILQRAAADGAAVMAGRCEERVTSALQAVRDAFGQLAEADPADLARWADGLEGPLLALIPSLSRHLDHPPVPVDAYAGIDVFLAALDRLASARPIVLLIDDLQWSDEPTRTFLERIERRLGDRPVTVVLTHRSGRADLPADVGRWIRRWTRSDGTVSIEVGGLGPEPARGLVQAVLEDASDSDIDELLAITEANCLFLTEALRDLPYGRETAHSVAELIAARVERQAEEVRAIISAGAALGPEFSFAVAARAADLDGPDALAAIDQAVEAELLHETASTTRYRFSHQLVPTSIVESLPRAGQAHLHHRCALALADEGAGEAEIVVHLLQAVPLVDQAQAIARARAAAAAAREARQFDLALRLLGLAHETEPPARTRAEIQLEIAELTNARGTPGAAIETLDGLAQTARTNGWPDLLVATALAHWSQSPYRKPADTTTASLLVEADAALGPDDSVDKALVLAKTAAFSVFTLRLSNRLAVGDRAVAMARAQQASPSDLLTVLEGVAIAATCPAGLDRMEELEPEIVALREQTGLIYFQDASAPETLPFMRADGAEFRHLSGRDPDRVAAQPIAEWRELVLDGTMAAFDGAIDQARDNYDRAAQIGEAFWGESAFSLHGFGHFILDLISGDWSGSAELLGLLVAFSPEKVFLGPYALALHHEGGRDDEIEEILERLEPRSVANLAEHIVGGNALVGCAELAIARDHDGLAQSVEATLTPLADQILGLPWAPGLAAAELLSRLAARRGDEAAAEAHRVVAADRYRSLGAPALLARLESP